MANWLKFVIALASAFLLMLAFRALAFTLYTVDGRALAPVFINGTASAALQQIDDKGYALPYAADRRKLYKVGISFSSETGTISEFEYQ